MSFVHQYATVRRYASFKEKLNMSLRNVKLAVLAAAASVGFAFFAPAKTANAGVVDLSAYGWMAFTDDNVDLTILSTSNNGLVLSLQKFADFQPEFIGTGEVNPLSIVFRQVSRSAVGSIAIEEENVINDTGVAWQGFRFMLEGGIAGHTPTFDTAASASFSTNPFPTKTFLNGNKELQVTGGTLSAGTFPSNLWQPGRTSGALVIDADPFTSGSLNQTFVFKEQPILIPLPAAAWTSLSGLVAVGLLVGAKKAKKILA
jgi:hypothetical protein